MDCEEPGPSLEYCRGAEDCLTALIDMSAETGMDMEKMILLMDEIVCELRNLRSLGFQKQWITKER